MTRVLFLLALSAGFLYAQPAGAQATPTFNPERATEVYLASVPASDHAKSDAYFEGGYWLILWDFLMASAVSLLLLQFRISARMRDWAARRTRFRGLQVFLYWIQYLVITYLLSFPLTVYESFFRERQYGLMNLSLAGWLREQGTAFLVSMLFSGLLVVALFRVVARLPRTWPIWAAAISTLFLAIGALIGPVFIAPLFNKYTVLTDTRISDPILSLARANGIPVTHVYQNDASKQSKKVSANVSGFLGTERITLNDNLLRRCSLPAILAVMSHEMGHYVLNHIYKNVFFFGVMFVIAFLLLRRALEWSLGHWGTRWGIRDINDVAVIPPVALIFSVFGFLFTPVQNTFIRTQEYEADMYGLNAARQPDGFAEAALLLGEYRKLNPGPLEEFFFFDHPSGRTRIYAAMRWKKENLPSQ